MNERIAQSGFWLTQSSLGESEHRIFVKKVCGFGALDEIFEEWSDEEKEAWKEPEEEISDTEALNIITGQN